MLHEALEHLPDEEYIFYADTDHVPYGLKTSDQIIEYVDEIIAFFVKEQASAVVIACNTATAVAAEYVRSKYDIPIIGMEPAVKPALRNAAAPIGGDNTSTDKESGRVLVMATPVTIRENKLHSLLERIDTEHKVDLLPMPELVRFAENEIFEDEEVEGYIRKQISDFDTDRYSEVVLGCTHFTFFRNAIRNAFGRNIDLIDGNEGTVRHLADVLGLKYQTSGQTSDLIREASEDTSDTIRRTADVEYYISGRKALKEDLDRFTRLHERLNQLQDNL